MPEIIDLDRPDGAARIAKALRVKVDSVRRTVAFEVYRLAALNTPVKTGRGRWGWYISVGAPAAEVPPKGEYGFPDVMDHGGDALTGGNISVDATIYITNNVGYLVFVNNGTRHIRPRRFVERTMAQARAAVALAENGAKS